MGLGTVRGMYEAFRLNHEGSSEGMANDVPYNVPRTSDATFGVPADFFLNGWQHALTGSETLVYFALHELRRLDPAGHDAAGVRLTGATRICSYGLSKDAYEDLQALCAYGLVDVDADPNRRADGTYEGFGEGVRPLPNRYRLVNDGLGRPAVDAVLSTLSLDPPT